MRGRKSKSPNFAVSQNIGRYKLLHAILLNCACLAYMLTGQVAHATARTQLYFQECARIVYLRALDFRRHDATLVY